MRKLLRPTTMMLACSVLMLGALVVLVPGGAPANQANPRPVAEGDQEIVWLNSATNAIAWERFVAALRLVHDRRDLGLEIVDDANAFPTHTTAVPEVAVRLRGSQGRLWFRWYKMTGELGTSQWVQALGQRTPPPLAIIGGGSSDRARDLAKELHELRSASPPLLLITTATADQVDLDSVNRDLMHVYPERSFRFCFTNTQMAEAIADFIWQQDALRPNAAPIYLVRWADDPYSNDLFDRFRHVLSGEGYTASWRRQQLLQSATRAWSWWAGLVTTGGLPPGFAVAGLHPSHAAGPFWSITIPYSLGTFSQPNYPETQAAERLLDELSRHPEQHRPLLILPAIPNPARRFLRALVRTAPGEAGQFVVATGDAIDLNTLYRDRLLTWPIQDLPVPLVAFCHRDPVDPSAFAPDQPGRRDAVPAHTGRTATGSNDLLLYRDIVETVLEAAYAHGQLVSDADALREGLRAAVKDGLPRFTLDGNQGSGTGEYVLSLQPVRVGGRVKPQALLQVWNATTREGTRAWVLRRQLHVDYAPPPPGIAEASP